MIFLDVDNLLELINIEEAENFNQDDCGMYEDDTEELFNLNDDDDEITCLQEEFQIKLDELELGEKEFLKTEQDIVFPYILIEGIESQEEFMFFRTMKHADATIPAYALVEGVMCRFMDFDLTLDSLLNLQFISDYKVSLFKSKDVVVPIHLNDPEQLLNFIKL